MNHWSSAGELNRYTFRKHVQSLLLPDPATTDIEEQATVPNKDAFTEDAPNPGKAG